MPGVRNSKTNLSPWLHQLKRTRQVAKISGDVKTDVIIIGGGIAGVVTAYYTLKLTDKRVVLLEANKVAHGATGHNAGQLASYFERPFSDIVREFGEKMAADGQQAVDSAWILLEEIFEDAKLQTPFWQFTGYAGCSTVSDVVTHLRDIFYQRRSGIAKESLLIAEEHVKECHIPKELKDSYTTLPQKDILALLETKNKKYVAALVKRKGCMNSALFTEELVAYLLRVYTKRFTLIEHAPVRRIALHKDEAVMEVDTKTRRTHTVTGKRVILCTNGFEKIMIADIAGGTDIDGSFHHLVQGSVGCMAGYLEEHDASPVAISYLPENAGAGNGGTQQAEPYFYLTRRPFEKKGTKDVNLICVGGPEALLDDTNKYSHEHPYPEEAGKMIDKFLKKNYRRAPGRVKYAFKWHGLMGYTPNGLRCVGFEPRNPVLMYNLGCNGVGILPSIFGGKRIALLLQGRKLSPSIFDPRT
ncbi:MAG: hypothetical protein A3F54_03265 [Candidatus Kerfeldbacteria bacterium RIFCSPHIGHO2_12_FULL_48_17]|uniref:FAD dependent oxidoreductase domain-containing protein n=1 Tax=Candidatus Kerfeldbacteria bacterium RIFCSPHIGHO2_12_FULL_48_17 TaxID=1798542 RepID=A0A1G2B9A1_9BACT|nr:MAG: hypothetical protein A3F54_03265 [Candidatus Kerfeldbacteria bacterium RIFCSPHIGHO2_12_FULL_48_17]